jgi:hypothetical protein
MHITLTIETIMVFANQWQLHICLLSIFSSSFTYFRLAFHITELLVQDRYRSPCPNVLPLPYNGCWHRIEGQPKEWTKNNKNMEKHRKRKEDKRRDSSIGWCMNLSIQIVHGIISYFKFASIWHMKHNTTQDITTPLLFQSSS